MKKLLRRFQHFYHNCRLQTKLTFTHLAIVLIPLVLLFAFFSGKLYNMVLSDTIRTEQNASMQTVPVVQSTVDQVLDVYRQLKALPFYRAVTGGLDPDGALDPGNFRREAQALVTGAPVTDIRVFLDLPPDHALFSDSETSQVFRPLDAARGSYWFGIFAGSGSYRELYCPSFYLSPREVAEAGDLAYIVRSSVPWDGGYVPCFTAVYFDKSDLDRLLVDNLTATGSVAYIINERNSLVSTSSEALSGIYRFDYNEVKNSFMSSNNFVLRTVLGEDVYTGFYNIGSANWYMVVVTPSKPILEKTAWIIFGFLAICLGCVLFAFLFATKLSRSITGRLSTVIKQMSLIRIRPPAPLPPSESHDEIGDLIDTYNYMIQMMNQLMDEQAAAAEDLRIAEFNSLQAQINPHFLYNTMDMINWLAQQGRTGEVSAAVQDLSRFYKLTLSKKEKITTLAQEIEHVSIYVRLQNMRYDGAIDFVVDIPDYMMDLPIPRLTFQPVVENSILHGLLEKDEKGGAIVLTGWSEPEAIVILISDDGVGIPPEKLDTILSGSESQSKGKGANIGAYNTHRRLQLLYGEGYGLTYRNAPGGGTEVEIRLPADGQTRTASGRGRLPAAACMPLVSVNTENSSTLMRTTFPQTVFHGGHAAGDSAQVLQDLHQLSGKLPRGESVYILSHMVTEDFPAHSHGYFELSYVCQGSVEDVVDGRKLLLTVGDLVVMNRQAVHSLRSPGGDGLLLNFGLYQPLFKHTLRGFYEEDTPLAKLLREENRESNFIFYSLGGDAQIQALITASIKTYVEAGYHQTPTLEALLLLLLERLSHTEQYSFIGMDERVAQVVRYLREHCLRATLPEMAAAQGLTLQGLQALVRAGLGREAEQVVRDTRLDRAMELLTEGRLNLDEIARDCGYQETGRFLREFRVRFGTSPEEYRKQFF